MSTLIRTSIIATLATTIAAETMNFGSLDDLTLVTKCIKIEDFESKAISEDIEIADKVDGVCPEGFTTGPDQYAAYWGPGLTCGWGADGDQCRVIKYGHGNGCADGSEQFINGCCGGDDPQAWTDMCSGYGPYSSNGVQYCVTYHSQYGSMDSYTGTSDDEDDYDSDGNPVPANMYYWIGCDGSGGREATRKCQGGCTSSGSYDSYCAESNTDYPFSYYPSVEMTEVQCYAGVDTCMATGYDYGGASYMYYRCATANSCETMRSTYESTTGYTTTCCTDDCSAAGGSETAVSAGDDKDSAHGLQLGIATLAVLYMTAIFM